MQRFFTEAALIVLLLLYARAFPSVHAKPLKENNGSPAATLIAIFLSVFFRQE
jgi:hypothetical protein